MYEHDNSDTLHIYNWKKSNQLISGHKCTTFDLENQLKKIPPSELDKYG